MWSEDNGPGTYEGDRWESQIELVKSISSATTRAIPSDTGCHLRFINRDTPEYNNLDETAIGNILNKYDRGNGWTPIGTKLREHVFDQLIYPDLESGKLIKRPFLVICITDGFPTQERAMKGAPVGKEDQNRNQDADRFRKEIRELQKVLDAKGYRDEGKVYPSFPPHNCISPPQRKRKRTLLIYRVVIPAYSRPVLYHPNREHYRLGG
jgi:hypothetical protein